MGQQTFNALKKSIRRSDALLPILPKPEKIEAKGINMLGLFSTESGLGEAARGYIQALDAASIPVALHLLCVGDNRANDQTYRNRYTDKKGFDVTLVHINGDFTAEAFRNHTALFESSYCIGFWTWELESFPEEWKQSLNVLHELWVPSTFVQKAIQPHVSVPVHVMPHVVSITKQKHGRSHYGIPPDAYTFLSIVDFHSVMERKNPIGTVHAFQHAFPSASDVQLVIKCSNAEKYPLAFAEMVKVINGDPRITIINQTIAQKDMHDLIYSCDAFASLHRSEGFGLALAEAMLAGKPVIATNYGGNTDFMNTSNSLLVDYTLTPLDQTYGPYKKGSIWAEPSISGAATYMQHLYHQRDTRNAYGKKATDAIQSQLNNERIGSLIQKRLDAIRTA